MKARLERRPHFVVDNGPVAFGLLLSLKLLSLSNSFELLAQLPREVVDEDEDASSVFVLLLVKSHGDKPVAEMIAVSAE